MRSEVLRGGAPASSMSEVAGEWGALVDAFAAASLAVAVIPEDSIARGAISSTWAWSSAFSF